MIIRRINEKNTMSENKNIRGQVMMINIMYFLMAIGLLVGTIPILKSLLDMAQQSDGLNCSGYYYQGNSTHSLSYNSSLSSNTLACVGIRLYLPYIILAVLIGGVTKILATRASPDLIGG